MIRNSVSLSNQRHRRLRQLLWLYFWLLILEGVLRKWILPGLSTPLLLVRDPVALMAIWLGWPILSRRPWHTWVLSILFIGILAFLSALTVGHGDMPTAAFGARILFLHFPLIFLYASVFDRDEVIHVAWVLVLLSIPMTLLLVIQSNLPSGHILNVAPGGEYTAVFTGALGRFRPAAVFSFINGASLFFTIAASGLVRVQGSGRLTANIGPAEPLTAA